MKMRRRLKAARKRRQVNRPPLVHKLVQKLRPELRRQQQDLKERRTQELQPTPANREAVRANCHSRTNLIRNLIRNGDLLPGVDPGFDRDEISL
jgi:hypothetical protein